MPKHPQHNKIRRSKRCQNEGAIKGKKEILSNTPINGIAGKIKGMGYVYLFQIILQNSIVMASPVKVVAIHKNSTGSPQRLRLLVMTADEIPFFSRKIIWNGYSFISLIVFILRAFVIILNDFYVPLLRRQIAKFGQRAIKKQSNRTNGAMTLLGNNNFCFVIQAFHAFLPFKMLF